MSEHRDLSAILLAVVFYLPSAVSLYFAWSVWTSNRRPAIAKWRPGLFKWGLISASLTMILIVPSSVSMIRTLERAHGYWLVANWLALLLWLFGLTAAITGKGSSRVVLLCWVLFTFFGLIAVDSAMIP
jgi:hypothetical protein